MALRTGGKRCDTTNIELGAVELHRDDSLRVHIDSRVGVGPHRIVGPAVPEAAGHGDELLCAPVPVGVVEESGTPEVLTGERVGRGHHVPAGAAVGQVVQGGELPCDFEWFVECGVDGACQADPVGDGGQRCQHGEGVGPADDVEVVDAAAMLTQPQPLGEEEEVEQATLGGAGQMHERVEVDLAARLGIRPHRGVVDARKVRGQVNELAVLAFSDGGHPVSPQRLAISSCERSRSACRCVTEVMTSSSASVTR
jgi:hypothetical protein